MLHLTDGHCFLGDCRAFHIHSSGSSLVKWKKKKKLREERKEKQYLKSVKLLKTCKEKINCSIFSTSGKLVNSMRWCTIIFSILNSIEATTPVLQSQSHHLQAWSFSRVRLDASLWSFDPVQVQVVIDCSRGSTAHFTRWRYYGDG